MRAEHLEAVHHDEATLAVVREALGIGERLLKEGDHAPLTQHVPVQISVERLPLDDDARQCRKYNRKTVLRGSCVQ